MIDFEDEDYFIDFETKYRGNSEIKEMGERVKL